MTTTSITRTHTLPGVFAADPDEQPDFQDPDEQPDFQDPDEQPDFGDPENKPKK